MVYWEKQNIMLYVLNFKKGFSYCQYFNVKKIIAKPLDSKFSNNEKEKVLTRKNTLLRQFENYIDNKCDGSTQRQFYSATECQRNSR